MKSWAKFLVVCGLGFVLADAAAADTLELKDGRILHGRYLGGTQAVLRFEINGEVQTFDVSQAVAVTFTGGSGAASAPAPAAPATPPSPAAPPAPRAAPPPSNPAQDGSQPPIISQDVPPPAAAQPAQDPAMQYGEVTLPAGQLLLVRMIDGVDSSKNHVGDVFHASLETDLYVHNALVARKGTDIYGRLANAQEAGHLSGSAELQLELMRIVIDGRDYPLVSSDYSLKGQGRGADTAKKVGGGAVLGAIIGAIAGGGKGAAIGAGAGSAAGAGVQIFTRGQQVKVPSETLLEFRLQEPTMVTPVQG
jgi:hypothetical protein